MKAEDNKKTNKFLLLIQKYERYLHLFSNKLLQLKTGNMLLSWVLLSSLYAQNRRSNYQCIENKLKNKKSIYICFGYPVCYFLLKVRLVKRLKIRKSPFHQQLTVSLISFLRLLCCLNGNFGKVDWIGNVFLIKRLIESIVHITVAFLIISLVGKIVFAKIVSSNIPGN